MGTTEGIMWLIGVNKLLTKLEGHGDLVSRLITPITHIVTLLIPILKSLLHSGKVSGLKGFGV